MHDDYLWDRSGDPDPEVVRLERVLAGIRHRSAPPPFVITDAVHPRSRWTASWQFSARMAAIAALLIVAVGALQFGLRPRGAEWHDAVLGGRPTVGRVALDTRGTLAVGQWLVTDASSRAEIQVGDIGSVEVAPNSRVRLISARPGNNRIELRKGLVRAMIFAPPREFAVEAPSATAIDLGCVYTLEIGDDGTGLLHVQSGWVAFASGGRESFVPSGASAQTRPDFGPGTPYFDDADEGLRAALARVDFEPKTSPNRTAALDAVLAAARPRDGITLWHLLSRVRPDERARVFDRLAQIAPPGDGVTRDGILRGDREMLEAWWDQLGLQPLSWWRTWERPWPPGK
jgi:FecR protein